MDWKSYEREIHRQFQVMYPEATITYNRLIPGRYSKTERQIDILIEDYIAGNAFKIIVDGKYFSKNIDVKEVESFIGMMQDVAADKGLLITQKGYSEAAVKRAYNDPSRIELDILNFEELKQFQAFGAIPFSGEHGVVMPSPFGWIIDISRREGFLATLYQRGLTLEEAIKKGEWMYVNLYSKTEEVKTLDDFCKFHESETLLNAPQAKIKYENTIKRRNEKTMLRIIAIDSYPSLEYTGFVEFADFIFFIVLFSPEELKEKNIKKLEYILARVIPIQVNVESIFDAELNTLENKLEDTSDEIEKAEILVAQGEILKKLKRYEECEAKFNQSLQILKSCYGAIKGKVDLYLLTKKPDFELNNAVDAFFELGGSNPTVCLEILNLFSEYDRSHDIHKIMERKLKDFSENEEAQGNINYHMGLLSFEMGNLSEATKYFMNAKKCFDSSLEAGHEVFGFIEKNLNDIKFINKTQ